MPAGCTSFHLCLAWIAGLDAALGKNLLAIPAISYKKGSNWRWPAEISKKSDLFSWNGLVKRVRVLYKARNLSTVSFSQNGLDPVLRY